MTCANLNLLSGVNSAGKSTINQALLLVGQNIQKPTGFNGDLVSLGEFEENRCLYSSDKRVVIEVSDGNDSVRMVFENREKQNQKTVIDIQCSNDNLPKFQSIFDAKCRRLQYLSCHRVGPQELYRKNMSFNDDIGNEGEFAIAYLNGHGNEPLDSRLCKHTIDYTLSGQVNWWLKYIMNIEVATEEIQGANFVKASYKFNEISMLRPTNIGAGVSYVISVIISCLSSPDGGIIIIENPEIHLHPTAQSKLCEFFYFIASNNRQLFIETHSDHIFNGFRAGIVSKSMDENLINIQFIYLNNYYTAESVNVKIGKYGKIENQQKDLFDQFDLDLNRMIGL